jgi:hypothetical protein
LETAVPWELDEPFVLLEELVELPMEDVAVPTPVFHAPLLVIVWSLV